MTDNGYPALACLLVLTHPPELANDSQNPGSLTDKDDSQVVASDALKSRDTRPGSTYSKRLMYPNLNSQDIFLQRYR